VLWAFCFGRRGFVVAPWIALAPLVLLLGSPRPGWLGWVHGLAAWLGGLYWIVPTLQTYGGIGGAVAVALTSLLCAYLGLYHAAFARLGAPLWRRFGAWNLLLLPSLWVALEWLRTYLGGGFPWNQAAYAWVDVPGALPLSAWVGALRHLLPGRPRQRRGGAVGGAAAVAAGARRAARAAPPAAGRRRAGACASSARGRARSAGRCASSSRTSRTSWTTTRWPLRRTTGRCSTCRSPTAGRAPGGLAGERRLAVLLRRTDAGRDLDALVDPRLHCAVQLQLPGGRGPYNSAFLPG
jgi:hypothetical protein